MRGVGWAVRRGRTMKAKILQKRKRNEKRRGPGYRWQYPTGLQRLLLESYLAPPEGSAR